MASKLLERVVPEVSGESLLTLHGAVGGEARLLGAVIKHAIYEWLSLRNSKDAKKRRAAEVARRWIFFKGEDRGTFDLYCNLLGADPQGIREMIANRLNSSIQITPADVDRITSSISS